MRIRLTKDRLEKNFRQYRNFAAGQRNAPLRPGNKTEQRAKTNHVFPRSLSNCHVKSVKILPALG